MPACDGHPASTTGGVNGALRSTFCGLKPQAQGVIERPVTRERRFGCHRTDYLYGEFSSEVLQLAVTCVANDADAGKQTAEAPALKSLFLAFVETPLPVRKSRRFSRPLYDRDSLLATVGESLEHVTLIALLDDFDVYRLFRWHNCIRPLSRYNRSKAGCTDWFLAAG